MTDKTIYDLKLFEDLEVSDSEMITRVPGGWVYEKYVFDSSICATTSSSICFIPYSDEFLDEFRCSCGGEFGCYSDFKFCPYCGKEIDWIGE